MRVPCFFLSLAVLAVSIGSGESVESPCPTIFRYVKNTDGTHYGEINVPAGLKQLAVKMYTTGPISGTSLRPKLSSFAANEENEARSLFRVDFPRQNPMPKVDKITVDRNVVCRGIKDPSEKVTSMFQLSQSNYRTSTSRNTGGASSNRSSHSSFYINHTSSSNSRNPQ